MTSKPFRRFGTIQLAVLILGLCALLLASCASEMAERGVSNRPQNAPSSWEGQRGSVDGE